MGFDGKDITGLTVSRELRWFDLAEVMRITSLGRSTIYNLMKDGKFPKNFAITARRKAWWAHEVQEWMRSRAGGG